MFKIMRKLYSKFCMLSFHLWIIIRPHNHLPHNHAGKGVRGGSLTYTTYLHSPRKSPHSSECVTEAPGDSGWSRGNSCIPGVLSPSSLRLRVLHLHFYTPRSAALALQQCSFCGNLDFFHCSMKYTQIIHYFMQ